MKYKAFISYRHGEIDEMVAEQVQKEIEKYHVPAKIAKTTGQKRVGRVFRDADELQASSDLSAVIREALDESEWLIVIATQRYKESPWCLEEIEYFIRLRGRERIIVILASGEPKDVFPEALTKIEKENEIIRIEPLAVDVRAESERAIKRRIKIERFRFFSSMLGVSYDNLRNRQRERRMKRMIVILGSAFIILASVIGLVTFKNIQLNEAYDALEESNQETLRGESYYLAEYSDTAYKEGDIQTAIKLALSALPKDLANPDRPYVADAVRSLTQATEVYDYRAGYRTAFSKSREKEAYDARTQISKDGKYVLIETFEEAADRLDRDVSVVRSSDGEEVCSFRESSISRNSYCRQTQGAALSSDGERLYYLGEKGLTCINISDGREIFTVEEASDMRFDPRAGTGQTAIVTLNYNNGMLIGYDTDGKKTISMDISNGMNYELGRIDAGASLIALAANTDEIYAVLTIDIKTGEYKTYSMEGPCSNVHFSGENRLCFLMADTDDGLKHIVQYETETGEQRFLCNTEFEQKDIILSDEGTCYYYINNTIYEVDCNDKKGKIIWKNTLPSEITSVKYGDGVIAVSCRDGSVNVFEQKSKQTIRTPDGAGEPVYVESISDQIHTTRDYWGLSVRVYKRNDEYYDSDAERISVSDITGGVRPKNWYTAATNCDRFLLGLYFDTDQKLAGFDAKPLKRIIDKKMSELGFESSDNKSFSQVGDNSIFVLDYDYYQFFCFDTEHMNKTFSESLSKSIQSQDDGKTVYVSDKGKTKTIDVLSGKTLDEMDIPSGFDSSMKLGNRIIYTSEDAIRIDSEDGKTLATIKNAELYGNNEKRQLIFYKESNGDNWYAYDVVKLQNVCSGKAGNNENIQFFGNNRYVLVDYCTIYDMNNWHKELELKVENGNVYGAYTTDDLPYFVIWCRKDVTGSSGIELGVIYEKKGTGEPVGIIPNFVTMSSDGEVIVYDGEQSLYKFPLLSVDQVMKKAVESVGDTALTDRQKEKYHLYG